MNKVFLSYSRKDKDFVKDLYNRLTKDGIKCFYDEKSIEGGKNWVEELEKGIEESEIIVFVLSPDFCESPWPQVERTTFMSKYPERKILPLLRKSCKIPTFLNAINFIDVTTNNSFNNNYSEIRKILSGNGGNGNETNPYSKRGRLEPDSNMFFGRKSEINTIKQLLDQLQCISLIGERKIGRSSLAYKVYHELKFSGNIIAIYLDCDSIIEDCSTSSDFYKMVNREFKGSKNSKQIHCHGDYFECYTEFRTFIKKLSDEGYRFVILIDEFEKLPEKEFANKSFFSNLRHIATSYNLVFVTVSKQYIKELTYYSIQSSDFWNIFTPFYLGMLDKKDINELRSYGFNNAKLELTNGDLKMINYYAGKFPFFNQLVCWYLFEAKVNKTAIDKNKMEEDLKNHYDVIWNMRTKEEKEVLTKITQHVPNNIIIDKSLLNNMINKGILSKEPYRLFSNYFNNLIKKEYVPDRIGVGPNQHTEFMKY